MSVQKCQQLRKEIGEYGHARSMSEIANKVKQLEKEIRDTELELTYEAEAANSRAEEFLPLFKDPNEESKTLARAYRDARREVSRLEPIIDKVREKLDADIEELKQEFLDAELELKEVIELMHGFANELKPSFMVKVDDDVVFRLVGNDRIQIQKIEEE